MSMTKEDMGRAIDMLCKDIEYYQGKIRKAEFEIAMYRKEIMKDVEGLSYGL